jgi:2-amino-4-hydroxy-6-hydroxymethyldihydropteridine diphosphokinase
MRCGIALGSNLGDRVAHLSEAVRRLALPVSAKSSIYETAPVECADDDPPFANAVIEIEYDGTPEQLLARTQAVEIAMGRPANHPKNAPRTIDLDILYCGDTTIDIPDLTLPHPRLGARRFVLVPLAEISPTLVLADNHLSIAEHLRKLDTSEPDPRILISEW